LPHIGYAFASRQLFVVITLLMMFRTELNRRFTKPIEAPDENNYHRQQESFPAGTPGNGVPRVILTVGTAFKPALGELYKKHPVFTKIRLFEIQTRKFLPSPVGRRYPTQYPSRSSRIRRSNSAPRLPHLLILEPSLFGSHTSFLGNDPCR